MGVWLLAGLGGLLAAPSAHAEVTAAGLNTRVNGQTTGRCSRGICRVTGGIRAGPNLFYRFGRFGARGDIRRVRVDTRGRRTVVLAVGSRRAARLDVPIVLSDQAHLIWLAPAGLQLGAGTRFAGVDTLLLSTSPTLRIGSRTYRALLDGDRRTARLKQDPLPAAAGQAGPDPLAELGLGGRRAIELAGARLQADRDLLLFSGEGTIRTDVGGAPGAAPALEAGGSVRLVGGHLDLARLQVRGGGAGDGGVVRLETLVQADNRDPGTVRLSHAQLEGPSIQVRAGARLDLADTRVVAAGPAGPGSIQMEAGGGGARLQGSRLHGARMALLSSGGLDLRDGVLDAGPAAGSGGVLLAGRGDAGSARTAPIRLEGMRLKAPAVVLESAAGLAIGRSSLQAARSIAARAGGDMALQEVQLAAGRPGARGVVDLASRPAGVGRPGGAIRLEQVAIDGQIVRVRSGATTLAGGSVIRAPKGIIHLEASNPPAADRAWPSGVQVSASTLDVGVHTLPDLRRPTQTAAPSTGMVTIVDPTPSIGLFSRADVRITADSRLLASQIPERLRDPAPDRLARVWLNNTTGNVAIDARERVRIADSRIVANASRQLAGNLWIRSQGQGDAPGLLISRSLLSASHGAGSGDLRLGSRGGITVRDSRLQARTDHLPADPRHPDRPDSTSLFIGGELTLTNQSRVRPIRIQDSRLLVQQTGLAGPLPRLGDGPPNEHDDDDLPRKTGGIVSVVSAGGIRLEGADTTINAGSNSSTGGNSGADSFGGLIRVINLSARPIRIGAGAVLSATTAASADPGAEARFYQSRSFPQPITPEQPLPAPQDLRSRRGEIMVAGGGDIRIADAVLQTASQYRFVDPASPWASGLQSVHQGRISLLAAGSLDLQNSRLTHGPIGVDADRTPDPAVGGRLALLSATAIGLDNVLISPSCANGCPGEILSRPQLRAFRDANVWGLYRPGQFILDPARPASDGLLRQPEGGLSLVRQAPDRAAEVVVISPGAAPVLLTKQPFQPIEISGLGAAGGSVGSRAAAAAAALAGDPLSPLVPPTGLAPLALARSPIVVDEAAADPPAPGGQERPLPRVLSAAEARAVLLASEEQAQDGLLRSLPAAAGRRTGLSLPSLQRKLLQATALRQQAARRPGAGAFAPAIVRIAIAPLPAADQLEITQILVPPQGEVSGWSAVVSASRLRALIRDLQQHSRNLLPPASDANAADLTRMLLAPVLPELQRQGINALLLSLDRSLQSIPFAALPVADGVLIDHYALSVTPSLLLLNLDAPPPGPGDATTLLAGSTRFGGGLAPLPMVAQELGQIRALSPAAQVMLNDAFTPQALLSRAADPAVASLHLATHADFQQGFSGQAAIHTARGLLPIAELARAFRSRSRPLQFFVLSGCRTSLGDEQSELGIAGLALQTGSTSALGTLWYVDDVAQAAFSVQLYRHLRAGLGKDQALATVARQFRSGQITIRGDAVVNAAGEVLLAGLPPADQVRLADGFRHSYYWAGFVLSGLPW